MVPKCSSVPDLLQFVTERLGEKVMLPLELQGAPAGDSTLLAEALAAGSHTGKVTHEEGMKRMRAMAQYVSQHYRVVETSLQYLREIITDGRFGFLPTYREKWKGERVRH